MTRPQPDSAPGTPRAESGRADQVLVARGLARSRAVAQTYIREGRVRRGGDLIDKPSQRVTADEPLELMGEPEPWVGRAAYKLLGALEAFEPRGLRVTGRRCLDVGASTGGFTQVLLAYGAAEVTALDVGRGQLAAPVRDDPRVHDLSGTSVRDVGPDQLGGTFALVVGDLSFISLRLVLEPIAALVERGGDVVLLVKPQFEVGREALGRTGVVRSLRQRIDAVQRVIATAADQGLYPQGLLPSPMIGTSGNREYLLWLSHEATGMMTSMKITEALGRGR